MHGHEKKQCTATEIKKHKLWILKYTLYYKVAFNFRTYARR